MATSQPGNKCMEERSDKARQEKERELHAKKIVQAKGLLPERACLEMKEAAGVQLGREENGLKRA